MTYNIHSGIGTDDVPDLQRIADVVKSEDPDLLAVQEVSNYHQRTPELNIAQSLAEMLNMEVHFQKAININDGKGEYGLALFSKQKLQFVDSFFLPVPDGHEKRIFLVAKVELERPIYFAVTHFSYRGEYPGDEQHRNDSAKIITEYSLDNKLTPIIWTGDFNCTPDSTTLQYINKHWQVFNQADPDTATINCKRLGPQQIDYICAIPKNACKLKKFKIVDNLIASDHKAVCAEITIENAN